MVDQYKFHVLIIEDEEPYYEFIVPEFQNNDDIIVFHATNAKQAMDILENNRIHFASIDQNIPRFDGDEEDALVGLDLCEYILNHFPMTSRAIYTAYGKIEFAQRAGALGDTSYSEKAPINYQACGEAEEGISYKDYVSGIVQFLRQSYISWSLEAASRAGLPRLSALTKRADDALGRSDLQVMFKEIALIRELALWYSVAITAAYLRTQGTEASLRTLLEFRGARADSVAVETNLRRTWKKIFPLRDNSPNLITLFNFMSDANHKEVNLFDSLESLRELRNAAEHGRMEKYAQTHLVEHREDLLRLFDLIAQLSRLVLATETRRHPSKPNAVRFIRLKGQYPWSFGEAPYFGTELARSKDGEVWGRLGESGDVTWLNLSPFISIQHNQEAEIRPHILISAGNSRWNVLDLSSLHGGEKSASKDLVNGIFR